MSSGQGKDDTSKLYSVLKDFREGKFFERVKFFKDIL